MQLNKDIKNFCTINENESKNAYDIYNTLSKMKIRRIGEFFNSVKRCGIDASDILLTLLLMPFLHCSSIPKMLESKHKQIQSPNCSNNVFYDFKNNPKVNWRALLYLVALRFKNLSKELTPEELNKVRAIIVDDSPLEKSGKKIEYTSRLYDHVSDDFIFGYKILVMGYWDGLSFYPLDFSLHREKGHKIDNVKEQLQTANKRLSSQRQEVKHIAKVVKQAKDNLKEARKIYKKKRTKTALKQLERAKNKLSRVRKKDQAVQSKYAELENKAIEKRNELKEIKRLFPDYGLTNKQKQEQFTKERGPSTAGAERAREVDIKKTTNMQSMLKRALRRGFEADYLLTDSWFFNSGLVQLVAKLNKKHKINLISMAKMGTTKYRLLSNSNYYNTIELLTKFKRKARQARSHNARYLKIPVTYNDVRINLFFIKLGQNPNWKLLVTTDLSIKFQKLIDTYQIRWSIELFFRESKQYLNLGKCRSTCFDSQIADTTISLVQYTILSFHQRLLKYSSFEGAFAAALDDALQFTIATQLQEIFKQIIEVFSDFAGIDSIEITRSICRNEEACNKIKKLNHFFYEKLETCAAA